MPYTHNATASQANTESRRLGDSRQGEQVASYTVLSISDITYPPKYYPLQGR